MKILTVEDDPVAQVVLEVSLRQLGHSVVVAADGDAAWAKLQADTEVWLVVSDGLMPGLNGLELCRPIWARSHDYVYFVLLTL